MSGFIQKCLATLRSGPDGLTVNEGGEVATFSVVSLKDGTTLVRIAVDTSYMEGELEKHGDLTVFCLRIADAWKPKA